ncbi:MAG TPA: zinc ribbon domain-containing protein [Desulfomonilaceae bacterium]|nr:zinc ribbon domain-containing protein [Desulfomonilaceae bacterium]
MDKKHISAHQVVQDINSGMDDSALMGKYALSAREVQALMKQLVAAKLISESACSELQLLWAQRKGKVWRCPACRMPQSHPYEECPQCGIIVAKFIEKHGGEQQPALEPSQGGEKQEYLDVPPDEPEVDNTVPSHAETGMTPSGPAVPVCGACTAPLPPDAKFCPSCGAKAPGLAPG